MLCFRVGDTVYLSDRSAGLGMVMGVVVSRGGYMVSPALSTPSTSVRVGLCKHVTEVREGSATLHWSALVQTHCSTRGLLSNLVVTHSLQNLFAEDQVFSTTVKHARFSSNRTIDHQ